MLCLGIETSCDETALALVRDGKCVESVLATQMDVHALFGGVVPEIASREHYRFLGALYDELMRRTGLTLADVDVVAVTRGPGLLGALLVGVAFAKGLSLAGNKPLIAVNHLHAHLLAVGLEHELQYPLLGLLVSGGHTHLVKVQDYGVYEILGRTRDDAAGEAFDKVARSRRCWGCHIPAECCWIASPKRGLPMRAYSRVHMLMWIIWISASAD